ncbi:MAG: hypothetical protein UH239_00900 [Acutalibacteraceae bacterium]|nr:hypothetical protein [Acutalibacteraceae bacterium]
MKEKELKEIYSNPPKSFHYALTDALNKIEEQENKKVCSRILKIALVCALVGIIGVTCIMAGSAIYPMLANSVNKYGLDIEVEPMNDSKVDYVKLRLNYLPENVEEMPNTGGRKYSQKGDYNKSVFSFILYKVDEKTKFTNKYITSYEEFEVNGNKALITNASLINPNSNISKHFYIFFENKGMFLSCYVSDDVSNDEIKKVMGGIELEKGNVDDYFEYSLLSDEEENINPVKDVINNIFNNFSNKYKYEQIYDIGQTIAYKDTDYFNGHITIDKIEVRDNIEGLDENNFYIPAFNSIRDITDENGNITPYERYTYVCGDGETDLDKIEKVDYINRKLVYVTTTVSNDTSEPQILNINEIMIEWLKEKEGKLDSAYLCDESLPETTLSTEINYIDNNESDSMGMKSGYYQLKIDANSRETIHLGYFVDEDTLDELYITIDADGELDEHNYSCVKVR